MCWLAMLAVSMQRLLKQQHLFTVTCKQCSKA